MHVFCDSVTEIFHGDWPEMRIFKILGHEVPRAVTKGETTTFLNGYELRKISWVWQNIFGRRTSSRRRILRNCTTHVSFNFEGIQLLCVLSFRRGLIAPGLWGTRASRVFLSCASVSSAAGP